MKCIIRFSAASLFVFYGCNSQSLSPPATDNPDEKYSALSAGDTVHEISKAIMVIYQDKKNN